MIKESHLQHTKSKQTNKLIFKKKAVVARDTAQLNTVWFV